MSDSKGNTLYYGSVTINYEGKKLNNKGEKASCANSSLNAYVLGYEHNTENSKDSTHYHKYQTANSQRRTHNYGGTRKRFEHYTTNDGFFHTPL